MPNILIVDDDKDILRLMEFALQRAGHRVAVANSGPQGLDKVQNDPPQLIIADIMMPDMTGYEFTRQVREMPEMAELPILIYSARFQPVDKQAALDAGATDYMPKTLSPPEIVKRIEQILGQKATTPAPPKERNITVAFFSLRGGVGVTCLATNAAVALALGHKTPTSLTDLNPIAGHAGLMLKLRPKNHVFNLLSAEGSLSLDLVKQHLSPHPSQVQLLASPLIPPNKPAKHSIENLTEILSAEFRFNLLDLPHIFDETIESLLPVLTKLVLVLSPDVPSLQSAVAAKQLLVENGFDSDKLVLLLNHNTPVQGLGKETIEKALQKSLATEIPFEQSMMSAVNSGTPLMLHNSKSATSAAIARFAVNLTK